MSKLITMGLACGLCLSSFANEIKHRFLAADESGDQLLYVDQVSPQKSWSVDIQGKGRDMQLIGKKRLLLSHLKGYYEIDIENGKILKEFKQLNGIMTARRTSDGKTYLGNNANGITIIVLDKNDKEIKKLNLKGHSGLRLMRITAKNTILLGANTKTIEIDMDGNIIKETFIPGAKHIYKVVKLPNDTTVLSAGYGGFLAILDKDGNIRTKIGTKAAAKTTIGFFADFQILPNGNFVVTNWHGHGRAHSKKGPQILEFDKKGELVWSWHDAEAAGCIHGVIVLDKVKTQYLHNDSKGKMMPQLQKRRRSK